MVRHSSPFGGRYSRYVLSILLFGLLGPVVLSQWGVLYSFLSVLFAALITIGYDRLIFQIAKQKSTKIVREQCSLIVHAMKPGSERKGFLVITENFVLFAPNWNKIKTILDTEQIVRHEFNGHHVELTVRFPNKHRMFQFYVSSPERTKQMLTEKSGESLPYKYDKMESNKMV
ncbi:hypothetical protein ACM26V_16605 [Salipaludibacillus sp. HK11]|uniref:hypothetical protein n=1 Tax=Salipaludibacillus sp. HK11 TaxID=3394320 RepID=UPI0039FC3480